MPSDTNIIIWTGSYLPKPAPDCVVNGFQRAEITLDAETGDGFQLTFGMSKNAVGEYSILMTGALAPFSRVMLAVQLGVLPTVLIDGIITHHQISNTSADGATLTVTGKDLSVVMDLKQVIKSYDNQPDSLIVLQILAKYALYKLTPHLTPTPDLPVMVWRTPWQTETDLRCIKRLAQRNGYVFYIAPTVPGVCRAYFGPENRLGVPQRALTMNMGGADNLNSIQFTHDAYKPMSVSGHYMDKMSKLVIPAPSPPFVPVPPLSLFPTRAQRESYLPRTAHLALPNVTRAATIAGQGTRDAVTAEGELDPSRYGGVLKVRELVGVRGVGLSYDGNYFVRKCTHKLEPGKHTQSFTLCREGILPLTPTVIP